jgi:hypothetical protein
MRIACTLSIEATRTSLGSNWPTQDEGSGDDGGGVDVIRSVGVDTGVGTGLGTESVKGGVRSALEPTCWSGEANEGARSGGDDVASGAPMHSKVHEGATLDRAAAALT